MVTIKVKHEWWPPRTFSGDALTAAATFVLRYRPGQRTPKSATAAAKVIADIRAGKYDTNVLRCTAEETPDPALEHVEEEADGAV